MRRKPYPWRAYFWGWLVRARFCLRTVRNFHDQDFVNMRLPAFLFPGKVVRAGA